MSIDFLKFLSWTVRARSLGWTLGACVGGLSLGGCINDLEGQGAADASQTQCAPVEVDGQIEAPPPQGALSCGAGTERVGDECVAAAAPQGGLSCGEGTAQVGDECVAQSPALFCAEGTVHDEDRGACVVLPQAPTVCPPGQHAVEEQCVPDCAPDELALDEICLPRDALCDEGAMLHNGVCALACPPDMRRSAEGCVLDGYAYIAPGTFLMGSPAGETGRVGTELQHEVRITRGFWMKQAPVTQAEWVAVMGRNPSCYQEPEKRGCSTANSNPDAPVDRVSWFNAVSFANLKSEQEGLSACYHLSRCSPHYGPADDPFQCGAVHVLPGCAGYRLPTEAEWEYAYRAGTTGAYYHAGALEEIAWYASMGGEWPKPVGQKLPNAWGLYDMAGNVWEWVWDWMDTGYVSEAQVDPQGINTGGRRVIRGGAWHREASFLRAATRLSEPPTANNQRVGLRLVRMAPEGISPPEGAPSLEGAE